MAKKKSSSKKSNGKKNYPNVKRKNFVKKEERGYPINTRQRAKSALGFSKMHHGSGSSIHQKVKRRVRNKYPRLIEKDKKKNSKKK